MNYSTDQLLSSSSASFSLPLSLSTFSTNFSIDENLLLKHSELAFTRVIL